MFLLNAFNQMLTNSKHSIISSILGDKLNVAAFRVTKALQIVLAIKIAIATDSWACIDLCSEVLHVVESRFDFCPPVLTKEV